MLLAALAPNPERFRQLLDTDRERLDWAWIVNRALAHKVGALFAARVQAAALEPVLPPDITAALDDAQSIAVERTAQAEWTLQRVARQFDHAGVPFLLLKGGVLAEHVYQSPSHRPFSDVDLLVSAENLERADEALKAEGYVFHRRGTAEYQPTEAAARQRQLALQRHFQYTHADRARYLPVDLHWRLTRPGTSGLQVPAVWDETEPLAVSGVTVRSLKPEALLLHLALHALELGPAGFQMLHLCDVAWAATTLEARVDRRRLWRLAGRSAARNELRQALQLAARLLECRAADRLSAPHWFFSNDLMFRMVSSETALIDQRASATRWLRRVKTTADKTLWELGLMRLPQKKLRRWLLDGVRGPRPGGGR